MIDRRYQLSYDEFRRQYYEKSPVVISGLINGWPALTKWTPQYLIDVCGDSTVEIMADRDSNPNYEVDCNPNRQRVQFADYVRQVKNYVGNNLYMVARNEFMRDENNRRLTTDLLPLHYLTDVTNPFFWFGPEGTITPLHYDPVNILFLQMVGRKRFAFISPEHTANMYNSIGVWSDVNYDNPNLNQHPLFASVPSVEVILNAGDALYLPNGWWHWVQSLSLSISLSYTNFR